MSPLFLTHSRLNYAFKCHFFSKDSCSIKITEQNKARQTFKWHFFLDFLRLVFGVFKPEDHFLMSELMLCSHQKSKKKSFKNGPLYDVGCDSDHTVSIRKCGIMERISFGQGFGLP